MDDISISKLDNETLELDDMSDIGDIEVESTKPKKKKEFKLKNIQPKISPKPKPENIFKNFNDKTFETFSNPQKKNIEPVESEAEEISNDGFDDNMGDDEEPNYGFEEQNETDDELKPSPGFQNIDDEKQDLLYKFHRIEQKGIKVKKFTMYSDIREMRAEFNKIKKDAEMTSGVKFSKRLLMTLVSGMEFLNKRYDPLGIELNGWSESVMENMNDGDYDSVLEKLHEKYSGKVNTPPEIELMLSLAGSAVMFHMTSSMFKSAGPSMNDFVKQNPNFMQDIMKKATNNENNNENNNDKESNENDTQKKSGMKGPSMDLSMFGPPPPMSTSSDKGNMSMFQMNDDESSLASEDVSVDNTIKEVSLSSVATSKKSSRRKKKLDESKGINLDI